MADYHSLARALAPTVELALRSSPVVVLTGARQTGKSTLARRGAVGEKRTYLTLDDTDVLERARREPRALLREAPQLTLDEVQRAPELLLAVKQAVDEKRTAGRFLLTGSANLLLMKRVADSLAGRAAYLTLHPMTRRELQGKGSTGAWGEFFRLPTGQWMDFLRSLKSRPADWREAALRGGYPTPAHHLRSAEERALWHAGYAQTYLERDLRELATVDSIVSFRRLMRVTALRLGNLVNQAELGRDVGLPQTTVRRYLDLLEISYQLARVPAFTSNRTSRLIKTPKVYWNDVALALHLAGEDEPRGAHLENLVLCDLLAWGSTLPAAPQVHYWRTASGREVDFVVQWKHKLLPIEVKATVRPRLDDAAHLRAFLEEYGKESRAGLLLHAGDAVSWLTDDILAAPWWMVL